MERAMFVVESGDDPKFTHPFSIIQQLLTLATVGFVVCLATAALLHCTIIASTKEIWWGNIFEVF
jgi:hypothetical protein